MKTKLIYQELLQSNSKTKSKLDVYEEMSFTLPPNDEARNYVVYFAAGMQETV